jgi:hypothetical protein
MSPSRVVSAVVLLCKVAVVLFCACHVLWAWWIRRRAAAATSSIEPHATERSLSFSALSGASSSVESARTTRMMQPLLVDATEGQSA